jgi:hypothetical protein
MWHISLGFMDEYKKMLEDVRKNLPEVVFINRIIESPSLSVKGHSDLPSSRIRPEETE